MGSSGLVTCQLSIYGTFSLAAGDHHLDNVTMSKAIDITFELNSPRLADSPAPIPSRQSYVFSLTATSGGLLNSNSSDFYGSLRDAISAAKSQTGEDLTRYRDIVGGAEKHKVPMIGPASDDEEEEE
ncbi:hypothetical protein CTheo_5984 [Ceratobasidium theobromae]|uniref:Uncharacterized protein n=1 Tax=Ceratobasidium theobromae TaxID=1582974 RepID=A0A5N5QG45_9AGAM|nr:hypothetical protein CTheo_5984 [Ceratobasidium theobromae]